MHRAVPTNTLLSVNTVARHGVMFKATLLLLCWLVSLTEFSDAVDAGCNYYQDLTTGTTYFVYNPEYPNTYNGPRSCMWTMTSDYRVNLTCNTQLPWSSNCFQDKLSVQINSTITHRYCGNGQFTILSDTNSMVVVLQVPVWSSGGRFLCEARAVPRPQDTENCRCGWKNPTRIVGGTNTGVNEFPMMAGVVDSINRNVFCGSTIVSIRYVVTAGHCIQGKPVNQLGVLVGDYDLNTGADTNATVLHRVIKAIIHPNYVKAGGMNDIAMLKTENTIIFGNQVGPACLPFQHSPDTFGGSFVDLLGWGSTDFGGAPSDILQKVTLSVLTNLQCSRFYGNVTADQICTYADGKDSCQMDSGGPVLWENPTTRRLVLIGIISLGRGCGVYGGINVRVGAYIDWIVSVASDSTFCIIE
ncbi:Venom serine protease 34 [Anthophora retusa]